MIRIVVKELNVGDVEDPELYLGVAWGDFAQTEQGKWIMNHGKDLIYHQDIDHSIFSYKYTITGEFTDEDALFFKLKWGHLK